MEEDKRINGVRYLRGVLAINQRLRLELCAAVSRLLREFDIRLEDDEVLAYLTLADEAEFLLRVEGLHAAKPYLTRAHRAPDEAPAAAEQRARPPEIETAQD